METSDSTLTRKASVSSGSWPLTSRARWSLVRPPLDSTRSTSVVLGKVDARGSFREPFARQPTSLHGGHDRGLDLAHQRRRLVRADAEQVRAGGERGTAASGMPRPADAPAMSSASLTSARRSRAGRAAGP